VRINGVGPQTPLGHKLSPNPRKFGMTHLGDYLASFKRGALKFPVIRILALGGTCKVPDKSNKWVMAPNLPTS